MTKSLLRRITPQDLLTIRDSVAYDPTIPNGLRWLVKRKGRKASGTGRNVWIGQSVYQASNLVMILNGKWPADGDSIVIRIENDGPWGDVDNLTWAPRGSQAAGGRDRNQQQLLQSVLGDNVPDLGDRLRLASLCKRGHQWNGHPVTLQSRRGSEWRCLDCERENNASSKARDAGRFRARYQANRERLCREAKERASIRRADPVLAEADRLQRRLRKAKIRQSFKEQGLTSRGTKPGRTPEQVMQRALERSIRSAGRCPSVARLVMDAQLQHWREHPKDRAAHDRQWNRDSWWLKYQTQPDLRLYHREKSKRRKAQARGQTPVQIPVSALRQRFNELGNCCAYCGNGGDMQIEHVEPISEGGAHDIGNIVPSCWPCNTSKRINDMESWYRSQPFFSELRFHRIRRVIRPPEGQQLALALA